MRPRGYGSACTGATCTEILYDLWLDGTVYACRRRGRNDLQSSKGFDATGPKVRSSYRPLLLTPAFAWSPGLRGATGETGHDRNGVRRVSWRPAPWASPR